MKRQSPQHRRRLLLVAVMAISALLLAACGGGTGTGPGAGEEGKIKAVTTYSIIYDLVRNVGGSRVEVTSLVPPGQDPHTYEPTPADIRTVAQADVVFYNGLGLELWFDRLVSNAGGDALLVTASDGVPALSLVGGEFAGLPDPHAWLDPALVEQYVHNIKEALISLDPDGREEYEANAAAYTDQLLELDQWIRRELEGLPVHRRKLVTTEGAFAYFAQAYDFDVVGFIFFLAPEAEPSPRYLTDLVEKIKAEQVPALFIDTTLNPRLVERLSEETGVPIGGALYVDSLGEPGSAVDTYIQMMRQNVELLVTHLGAGAG